MKQIKQVQKSKGDSTQVQAGTVYIGIDEKRVREIFDEKTQEVFKLYSKESQDTAELRIENFAQILIPKIIKEKLIETLKDPGIQYIIKESQETAAKSEREIDYFMLSELLVDRMVLCQ